MKIGSIHLDKNQLNALVFGFLVLLLPVAVYLASNITTDQRTQAAPTAHLELVPQGVVQNSDGSYTLPSNSEVKVDVMLSSTTQQIESMLAKIDYDPTVLSIDSVVTDIVCGNDPTQPFGATNYLGQAWARLIVGDTNVNGSIDGAETQAGSIEFACGAGIISIPFTPLQPFPANNTLKVATLTFNTLQDISAESLDFVIDLANLENSSTKLTALGCLSQTGSCENIIDTNQTENMTYSIGAVPTATPVPQAGGSINLISSDPDSMVAIGDTFTVNVRVDSDGVVVSGVDALIDYNPNVFTVNGIINHTGALFGVIESDTNTNGRVIIRGDVSPGAEAAASNASLATITFQAIASSSTPSDISVYVNEAQPLNDSNISAQVTPPGDANDILENTTNVSITVANAPTSTPIPPTSTPLPPTNTPVPTATPIPPTSTPTATPVPQNIDVTFSVNLQGRGWATGIMDRAISLRVYNYNKDTSTHTEDSNSPYSVISNAQGSSTFTIPEGLYSILIKPAGYLNSRVGTGISTSINSLETKTFRAGDLDGSGEINSLDYSAMLGAFRETPANRLGATNDSSSIADLDGSLQVNSLDYSLLISNWGECDQDVNGAYSCPQN